MVSRLAAGMVVLMADLTVFLSVEGLGVLKVVTTGTSRADNWAEKTVFGHKRMRCVTTTERTVRFWRLLWVGVVDNYVLSACKCLKMNNNIYVYGCLKQT